MKNLSKIGNKGSESEEEKEIQNFIIHTPCIHVCINTHTLGIFVANVFSLIFCSDKLKYKNVSSPNNYKVSCLQEQTMQKDCNHIYENRKRTEMCDASTRHTTMN